MMESEFRDDSTVNGAAESVKPMTGMSEDGEAVRLQNARLVAVGFKWVDKNGATATQRIPAASPESKSILKEIAEKGGDE